jgi:hypothetical protein
MRLWLEQQRRQRAYAIREALAAFEFYAQVNARLLVLVIAVTFGTAASSSIRRGLCFGESKNSLVCLDGFHPSRP